MHMSQPTNQSEKLLGYFAFGHLPDNLAHVAKPFSDAAHECAKLPSCAERTAGLRKLLEAKDCAVRAEVFFIPATNEVAMVGSLAVNEEMLYISNYLNPTRLPEPARGAGQQIRELAELVLFRNGGKTMHPQRSLAIQKLIEAKDCFVRAALEGA